MSPTTLRVYRAYLNVAFDSAVERGLLGESPMQVVPQPPRRKQAADGDMAFTLLEVQGDVIHPAERGCFGRASRALTLRAAAARLANRPYSRRPFSV